MIFTLAEEAYKVSLNMPFDFEAGVNIHFMSRSWDELEHFRSLSSRDYPTGKIDHEWYTAIIEYIEETGEFSDNIL